MDTLTPVEPLPVRSRPGLPGTARPRSLWGRMALLACLAIWIIASVAGARWLVIRMDPLGQARNAYLSGDYRGALRAAEDDLRRWPGNREAGLMAARCLSRLGRHQEAEVYYNRSGPIGLDELQVHIFRLARDLIAHHRSTEARGYLERALAGHVDARVLELLGVCYEKEGGLEKAEEYWRRAVNLDSKTRLPCSIWAGWPSARDGWMRRLACSSGRLSCRPVPEIPCIT